MSIQSVLYHGVFFCSRSYIVHNRRSFQLSSLAMSIVRTFYSLPVLGASLDGRMLMTAVMKDLHSKLHDKYKDFSIDEIVALVARMNDEIADVATRFVNSNYFGGVAYIQLSTKACDTPWVIAPEQPEHVGQPAVSRIALQTNGLVICKAPPAITAVWNLTPALRGSTLVAPAIAIAIAPECANCGARRLPLRVCSGCGLVRYCSAECQTAHWKPMHKKVCKWAVQCINHEFSEFILTAEH